MKTVSVQEPQQLTGDTLTDGGVRVRGSTDEV
jgi:hypothetical protein